MWKKAKAFFVGFVTAYLPYKTNWTSFDELAAYDEGRKVALILFGGAKWDA